MKPTKVLSPGFGRERINVLWLFSERNLTDDCTDRVLFFKLFLAPLCLVVGANKYFLGALYKNSDVKPTKVVSTEFGRERMIVLWLFLEGKMTKCDRG